MERRFAFHFFSYSLLSLTTAKCYHRRWFCCRSSKKTNFYACLPFFIATFVEN